MNGSFKWNINSATRGNYYSRYVVSQTALRCTSQYYNVNTKANFTSAWSNLKTQYQNMSTTNQGVFYAATANDSSYPGKGALRYDYLVAKYGLENFVNRSVSSFSNGALLLFALNIKNSQNVTIIVITVLSLVSVSTIGGYFFLRKRKEH